ncbi:LysR family transcriptional regulator [Echinimonas agarilytica]|uniref:LysR family transcriptional regulator n=1 Tax=Echinimonas agarilytica TaxID=1215918 RepID=A0AA42B5S5_9GAMM|nr:LysR family transcriptional regulator [Echinimonas agarilytica]MCM2678082.1 LysR family transcriptional regulator [Echinimonas agarilytica]
MLLEDLQVILKVAEFRNITAAAENLDMQPATASAAVKRVEKALGAELFIRTTRHLRLSVAGERYIPQCEQAMAMLEQAKQNMKEELGVVDGELRLTLSSDLGRNVILPWLDELMTTHPRLSLRANITDSNVDFYRDSVDMALRYGFPDDASLYGFKICNVPRLLCASQGYLSENGTPQHPHDLPSHNGLFYQLHDVIHDVWDFAHHGTDYKIKLSGNRASNDGELVRRWCVAGHGLAAKSALDMADDLLSQRVISVMPSYQPLPTELWLVCPSRQSITPAMRLLRDSLRDKTASLLQQLADKGIIDSSMLV